MPCSKRLLNHISSIISMNRKTSNPYRPIYGNKNIAIANNVPNIIPNFFVKILVKNLSLERDLTWENTLIIEPDFARENTLIIEPDFARENNLIRENIFIF